MQIHPNHLNPPFDNVKARQALMLMVNQEEYLRAIASDPQNFRVCYTYLGCGSWLETDAGADLLKKQDFEKAKQLLGEAGYKGEKLVVMAPSDFATINAASLTTAAMLRKIGVEVDLQVVDWGTLVSRRGVKEPPSKNPGGYHIFHTYSGYPALKDPWGHANISTACDKAWFGWPCSPRATKALEERVLRTGGAVGLGAYVLHFPDWRYWVLLTSYCHVITGAKRPPDRRSTADATNHANRRRVLCGRAGSPQAGEVSSVRTRSGARAGLAAALTAALALGVAGCVPAVDEPAEPPADTGNVRQQLGELTVATAGSMKGYSRSRFPHWRDTGKNCEVRDSVLQRDGESIKLSGCNVVGGRWERAYDGMVLTDPSVFLIPALAASPSCVPLPRRCRPTQ